MTVSRRPSILVETKTEYQTDNVGTVVKIEPMILLIGQRICRKLQRILAGGARLWIKGGVVVALTKARRRGIEGIARDGSG